MNLQMIRNAKIRTKFVACLVVLASLTAVMGYLTSLSTATVKNQFTDIVDVNTPRLIALLQLKGDAAKVETSVTEFGAATGSLTQTSGRDTEAKDQLLANLESLQNAQNEYARRAKTTPDKVKRINAAVDQISTRVTLLVSAHEQRASAAQLAPLYETLHSAVVNLEDDVDHLIDNETYQLRKSNIEAATTVSNQQKLNVLVQVVAFLLVGGIGFLLSRLIVRPLLQLRHVVDGIAKGKIDESIVIRSSDEIGQLASSIDKLRITVKYLLDDAKAMDNERANKGNSKKQ